VTALHAASQPAALYAAGSINSNAATVGLHAGISLKMSFFGNDDSFKHKTQ